MRRVRDLAAWFAAVAVVVSPSMASARAQDPAAAPPLPTGRIVGQVVASGSLEPVRALVELLPLGAPAVPTRVRANAEGRYELKNLAAGRYRVTARAEGYVALQFGQRQTSEPGLPIDLKDGATFEKADFVLPKLSAVEGVVVDEFGDPAPDVEVQVAQVMFAAGARRLMPVSTPRTTRATDDRGRFRIYGLPPGEYYLLTLSGPFNAQETRAGFAVTYYPGTTSAIDARPVRIDAGQDVLGLSIPLVPSPGATVSGRVLDTSGQPVVGSINLLQMQNGDVRAMIQARARTEPDGAFSFRSVPYGSYVIQASGGTQGFASLRVNVDKPEVADLRLPLQQPGTARGRIEFAEPEVPAPPPSRVRIFPRPVNFVDGPVGGGPPPVRINPDWTFEVSRQNSVAVMGLDVPAPWRVKSVLLEGKDVTDTPIAFLGREIDGFVITLTSRQTTVSGSVSSRDAICDCAVVVFAEDSARWTFPSRFVALARTTPDGKFTLSNLPPAAYLAVALPPSQTLEWQDPAFLEKLRAGATRFTLDDAGTASVTLVRR
jgi:hypothetical protein